jgi:RimJ/RimL family protein N-acetyltransferase
MIIETERLTIRPLTLDDFDAMHALTTAIDGMPRAECERWLQWLVLNNDELERLHQPPYGERALTLNDGTLIGLVGFVPSMGPFGQLPYFSARLNLPVDRRFYPEVGLYWALSPDQRGRGYATEAARGMIAWAFQPDTLNLRRIIATTEYDNEASQAVMRRLGMVIERNPYPDPFWFQVVGILENSPDYQS